MKTFRTKLITTFLLYGFLISFIAVAIIYNFYSSNLKTVNMDKTHQKLETIHTIFTAQINKTDLIIKAIQNSSIFKAYLTNPKANLEKVQSLFLTVAQTSNNIMQLRYINIQGDEKIRVDRVDIASKPFLIIGEHLQNKSQRYYFKEVIELDNNELWYSKIDLNKEYGQIEKPIKPVLRIGLPIEHQAKKRGILIVNIFMKDLINSIKDDSLYNIYIFDNDGHFLVHPNENYSWSKYLERFYTVHHQFSNAAAMILNNDLYQNDHLLSKRMNFNNGEKLKLIIEPKLYFVQSQLILHSKELLITLFGIVLLSFPLAYFFSKNPVRLKEQVDKFNETLEQKIQLRTNELNKSNQRLEKLATLDFLTQIPNRRYFFTMGKKSFHSCKRGKKKMSMLVFDIDHFKKVNDTYGHKVGDEILKLIAQTLQDMVRKEDIIARVGGEEFALILDDVGLLKALEVAEKLRSTIENLDYIYEMKAINITTSIGVTECVIEDKELTCVYDRADKALYNAKDTGRNCIKYLE